MGLLPKIAITQMKTLINHLVQFTLPTRGLFQIAILWKIKPIATK
jgi:hypothetical protein